MKGHSEIVDRLSGLERTLGEVDEYSEMFAQR